MRGPSPMYQDLAVYYDRIYSKRDYRGETDRVVALARRFGRSRGRRWLDVACGTGRHLEFLRKTYLVTGTDLSRPMLRLARRRLPGVPLVLGDMRTVRPKGRFDVVSCLFSAIGYLRTERDLSRAFRNFARLLAPGGVVIVAPWVDPADFRVGHLTIDVYEDDKTHLVRTSEVSRRGSLSRITFDYLIGEVGRGVQHVREVEVLRLTPPRRLRRLLEEAGLEATWIPPRRGVRGDRGWLVGVAPTER
jgi:SAM-dependent methyltransferase